MWFPKCQLSAVNNRLTTYIQVLIGNSSGTEFSILLDVCSIQWCVQQSVGFSLCYLLQALTRVDRVNFGEECKMRYCELFEVAIGCSAVLLRCSEVMMRG